MSKASSDCPLCRSIKPLVLQKKEGKSFFHSAYLDARTRGHNIIYSKEHKTSFNKLSIKEGVELIKAINWAMTCTKEAFPKLTGFEIYTCYDEVRGQALEHFHVHIMPRFADDDFRGYERVKKVKRQIEIPVKGLKTRKSYELLIKEIRQAIGKIKTQTTDDYDIVIRGLEYMDTKPLSFSIVIIPRKENDGISKPKSGRGLVPYSLVFEDAEKLKKAFR